MADKNVQTPLEMSFDPNTIEHLGVRMYSTIPPVLAELIANSYDANSPVVEIKLIDSDPTHKEIIVSDKGHGMSRDDINDKFLRIGRNRREKKDSTEKGDRKPIGKKGLGKLSFFGIADEIEVTTIKDGYKNIFLMKWEDIKNTEDKKNYEPVILVDNEECNGCEDGTSIALRKIRRVSDFNARELAVSLSKVFIVDKNFKIYVQRNDDELVEVENSMKYEAFDPEVEWAVPEDVGFENTYSEAKSIKGHLLTAKKPISPQTNMRGITLFSRSKMVNLPEYFSDSTSSHFYSYLTGELHVDFIDELDEDVIGTDRQSLNWGHPEMDKLRIYLKDMMNWLERSWREKRKELRNKKLDIELRKTGASISDWRDHVPSELNEKLTPVLESLVDSSELENDQVSGVVKNLRDLVPPYTYYHHSNLHPTLSSEVFESYKNEDYYNAVAQGVIKYVREIQKRSSSGLTDFDLIKHAFSPDPLTPPATQPTPELSVTANFQRPDGSDFEDDTIKNISFGHGLLARAMWQAFRNPVHHELAADLRDSGLYTEQDCLDALGLLSHLFRRLDNSL